MSNFLGEYYCKLDSKGRVMLPAGLKKQIPPETHDIFVVNRGFEQCLVIYTKIEWDKITEEINKLNTYVKKNREFVRYFYRGATELSLDASNRLLIPKALVSYAGIDKEVVLSAHTNKIEIWNTNTYENLISNEPEDFANLAESVMGNLKNDDQTDE